jgi:hypothetical protein
MQKLTFVFIFLLFAQTVSYACSCLNTPTVASEFASSEVVMVVRADAFISRGSMMGVNMVVEKVYKGTIKLEEKLFFAQGGGGDCRYNFAKANIGKQFLVYSNIPKNGVWGASICGRDQWVETAVDDLRYLNNLATVRGKSRVSGVLRYAPDPENYQSYPISGHKVKISGNGINREAVTNSDGVYEFLGLPSGVYSITLDSYPRTFPPFSRALVDYHRERLATPQQKKEYRKTLGANQGQKDSGNHPIYLFPKGSGGYDFYFDSANSVEGRVTGLDGKPLESADITFVSENGDVPNQRVEQTDVDGKYIIPQLSPGKYYIAVNSHGFVKADNPFVTTYYPGVQNLKQAILLDLKGGEALKNIDIRIPDITPTIWISGKVVYADNVPVEDADVKFESIDEPEKVIGDSEMRTKENGEFKIKVLKGLHGEITAEKLFWSGNYKGCENEILKGRVISSDYHGPIVATKPIPVNADGDINGLIIKYPFKSCPKAK